MAPQKSPECLWRLLNHPAATPTITPAPATTDAAVSLPNDLIFDILSRLPVKSLCRFRCVSTEWCSLISDLTSIAVTSKALVCVTTRFRKHKKYYNLQLMDMDGSVMRVTEGICGGELLSTSMDDRTCVTNYVSGSTRVIDPATLGVIAQCPKHEFRSVGFGRAVLSGAYKAVGLRLGWACKVFTLGDDIRWRSSRLPQTDASKIHGSPVAIKGIMYFLVSREQGTDVLLRFDIDMEDWNSTIEGPKKAIDMMSWKRGEALSMTEFNDALCVVYSGTSSMNSKFVDIWLLTGSDNNNTWSKAYTIHVSSFTRQFVPLTMTSDGRKLISHSFVSGQGHKLGVYDAHTKTCTTLHNLDKGICKIGVCSLQLDRFVFCSRPVQS